VANCGVLTQVKQGAHAGKGRADCTLRAARPIWVMPGQGRVCGGLGNGREPNPDGVRQLILNRAHDGLSLNIREESLLP